MLLDVRALPFQEGFIRFGQALAPQFAYDFGADMLDDRMNAIGGRHLRGINGISGTSGTSMSDRVGIGETCRRCKFQHLLQLSAHVGETRHHACTQPA